MPDPSAIEWKAPPTTVASFEHIASHYAGQLVALASYLRSCNLETRDPDSQEAASYEQACEHVNKAVEHIHKATSALLVLKQITGGAHG
jgi:hypothetical protein